MSKITMPKTTWGRLSLGAFIIVGVIGIIAVVYGLMKGSFQ